MSLFNIEQLRHSAAHLLAQAVSELFPETIFTIGPATETGFFYDMYLQYYNFKQDDLKIISEKMKEIVKRNTTIEHYYIKKEEAKKLFEKNKFKLEIIETQINDDIAGIAKQGDFFDLCKGGHVPTTGFLDNFILTGISGSYWRGNRDGDVLQRISGIIFHTKKELDDHLKKQEELEKYDHRRLGIDMELFGIHEEGPGFPFIYPKGMIVINELTKYMRELTNNSGYKEIRTPTMLSNKLWRKSGHWNHYKENMYTLSIDEHEYAIKPMNCPGAFLTYGIRPRSYRELPLRLSEFGHVHRHELSGTLHGMMRVRAFTQDDAHIFCTIDQIESEICNIILNIDKVLNKIGLKDISINITTKPEKASGNQEEWTQAIKALESALIKINKPFHIKEGDGAFYGPKIEVIVKDVFDRSWCCGTVQLDFVQPKNFDLKYVSKEGKLEKPLVIHQAMYGSLERIFAIILEHHKGRLPFWLSPVQIKIVTITDAQDSYSEKIIDILQKNNIRAEIDKSGDPLNAKLQRAIKEKVPVSIILGKKEMAENTVSIRFLDGIQQNGITIDEAINEIKLLNER
jgi:threonyl-tRNA synthetase